MSPLTLERVSFQGRIFRGIHLSLHQAWLRDQEMTSATHGVTLAELINYLMGKYKKATQLASSCLSIVETRFDMDSASQSA